MSVVRIPIPATPEALLNLARQLDRLWAFAEANGHTKPSLAEECDLLERRSRGQQ